MNAILRVLAASGAVGALAGCSLDQRAEERAFIAEFDPIETRDGFVDAAVGPDWQSDEIKVRFAEDGALSGDINGVPVSGSWEWQEGAICTTFRVSDSGGSGCSKVGIRDGELLVIPREGAGAPYSYRRI